MSDYWLKLYCEILDDPKMGTLSDHLWRRTIELFLAAKRLGKDGFLPDLQQIAWMLRIPADDQLNADLDAIVATGIIQAVDDGWLIVNFASRQAPSSPTERKRNQRDRARSQQYDGRIPLPLPGEGLEGEDPSGSGQPDGSHNPSTPVSASAPDQSSENRAAAAVARKTSRITPEERAWLDWVIDAFGEKMANPTQVRTAINIRKQFGEEKGREAILYYANKGRPLGESLSRAIQALPGWGTYKSHPPEPKTPQPASQRSGPSAAQLAAELKGK